MLVIDRNTYGLREYKECRKINVNPTQFFALEMLQSGNEIHYARIIQWINKRIKDELFITKDIHKEITPQALYMQMRRLKEVGIEVEYKKDHYRLKEKEVWLI